MEIQNQYIESIILFLNSLSSLPAKVSRKKVLFINKATEQLKQIQDERMAIVDKFGQRDENGELKKQDLGDGHVHYLLENEQEAQKELTDLYLESWIVEANEVNKDMLVTLRDYFLEYDAEIEDIHAVAHAVLCDALELVKYE